MDPQTSGFLVFVILACVLPTILLIVGIGLACAMRSSQISRDEEQRR